MTATKSRFIETARSMFRRGSGDPVEISRRQANFLFFLAKDSRSTRLNPASSTMAVYSAEGYVVTIDYESGDPILLVQEAS
ncbi:MAG: hypothetical protein ABL984_00375 [Pyrinomonadaceae bacterium]